MAELRQANEARLDSETDESDADARLIFDMVEGTQRKSRREAFADVSVQIPGMKGTHTLHAKVDPEADGNIILMRCVKRMKNVPLEQDGTRITAYNGTVI